MSIYFNQINNAKIIIKEKINYFVVNPLLSSYKLFINYIYNKNKNINKNKNDFIFYKYLNTYDEDFDNTSSPTSHIDIITSIHDDSDNYESDNNYNDDESYDMYDQ